MMMRSPGRALSEAVGVAFLRLASFELALAVDLLAMDFLAVDLLAVVFLALVFLAVVLLAGMVCLPRSSASLSLLLRLEARLRSQLPTAGKRRAVIRGWRREVNRRLDGLAARRSSCS